LTNLPFNFVIRYFKTRKQQEKKRQT